MQFRINDGDKSKLIENSDNNMNYERSNNNFSQTQKYYNNQMNI